MVNILNSLPDYIVHADTVICFKSSLDTFRIWYITSKPKLAEPEAKVKLYSKYYTNTLFINLYLEPGIEATACARELLYVYVLPRQYLSVCSSVSVEKSMPSVSGLSEPIRLIKRHR